MEAENPRAVIGANQPSESALAELAERITADLKANYGALIGSVDRLLSEARELPTPVEDDDTMGRYAKLIKDLRDTAARCRTHHDAEKQPHLRAGQSVDSFFFALWEKCARRVKTAKPGAADVLQARLDAYNQRKLLAEQERLRREAEEMARIARMERERAEREAAAAVQARLAAERARKPENIAAREQELSQATADALASQINAGIAAEQAHGAQMAALAKPADLVRTRVDQGPLVTMREEGYAEIVDSAQLDMAVLWPFIVESAKAAALRQWAKSNDYKIQMQGAAIGKRSVSVVR